MDAPDWQYTDAMQIEDGITVPYEISIAQVSATYGEGLEQRIHLAP